MAATCVIVVNRASIVTVNWFAFLASASQYVTLGLELILTHVCCCVQ